MTKLTLGDTGRILENLTRAGFTPHDCREIHLNPIIADVIAENLGRIETPFEQRRVFVNHLWRGHEIRELGKEYGDALPDNRMTSLSGLMEYWVLTGESGQVAASKGLKDQTLTTQCFWAVYNQVVRDYKRRVKIEHENGTLVAYVVRYREIIGAVVQMVNRLHVVLSVPQDLRLSADLPEQFNPDKEMDWTKAPIYIGRIMGDDSLIPFGIYQPAIYAEDKLLFPGTVF
ncbi:hypothetical protein IH979_02270 [Patescibacteria group bacterium]|nr:hypothetical protein [Patescibacteria group bacterium]